MHPRRKFGGRLGHQAHDRRTNAARGATMRPPYWSWIHVISSDIRTRRVTRLEQVQALESRYKSGANDPDIYKKYLTQGAFMKLGAV